jgi:hypothetical protein
MTDLEFAALNLFAYCEMNQINGSRPESHKDVHTYLWADQRAAALGITEQAFGGVLTSLQSKGLITVSAPSPDDKDSGVSFTEQGYAAWDAAAKAKKAPVAKPKAKAKPAAKKAAPAKARVSNFSAAPDANAVPKHRRLPTRPGVGTRLMELLKAGKDTDAALAVIHKEFPKSTATKDDVSIMRSKLRNQGKLA